MMKPCAKCGKNNWNYKFIEGWISATCNKCGYEVKFMSRRMKKYGWELPDDTPVSPDAEINQNKDLLELEFKNCNLAKKIVFKVSGDGRTLQILRRISKKQFELVKEVSGKVKINENGIPCEIDN